MLNRKLAVAIAAALLVPAVASAGNQVGVPAGDTCPKVAEDGWRFVGGEIGWAPERTEPSRLTRDEVQRALKSADVAADGWRFVGGEIGWAPERTEPSRLTRDEVQRALKSADVAADGWRFVGGEARWIVEGARLLYVNGRLVHADDCLFDPAKARPSKDDGLIDPALYRGA